jgi:hypothetical protein
MSKLKQGGEIPDSRLRQQFIHGKEVAPVYHKRWDETLIAAETAAMIQASNAGYRCVCIQPHNARPYQSSVYVMVDGVWKQGGWPFGKWGKLSEKDPGGIFKVPLTPAPLLLASSSATATTLKPFPDAAASTAPASPLAGSTARIEAVTPLWPEADSPEMETMARRLVELAALEPLGITVPYTLDVAGV